MEELFLDHMNFKVSMAEFLSVLCAHEDTCVYLRLASERQQVQEGKRKLAQSGASLEATTRAAQV